MCEEESKAAIDRALLKKYTEKLRNREKPIQKEYEKIMEEKRMEKRKEEELREKYKFWSSLALNNVNSYISMMDDGDLTYILYTIEHILRNIALHLRNSGLSKLKLLGIKENVDEFRKMCQINMPFSRMLIAALVKIDSIGMIICRRTENSIIKLVAREKAPYILVINTPPLPTAPTAYGCSWAIYMQEAGNTTPYMEGKEAVSAGYAVIGPTITLVLAFKNSDQVMEFVLDSHTGNFIKLGPIQLPDYAPIFVFDDSKVKEFSPNLQRWIGEMKKSKGYKNWYTGQFIVDFNKILHTGGLYISPSLHIKDQGKLRLLLDCVPAAYILARARGVASDGRGEDLLGLIPLNSRQHTPFYAGSRGNMKEFLAILPGKLQ